MKIALISGSRIPSRTANSIQTMKMAQAVAAAGHQVRVFVPGSDPKLDWGSLASHYGLQRELAIHWVPTIPQLRSYDFGLQAVRAARRWDAQVIYTRHPQAAAFASWSGEPTVFEVHDMPSGSLGPRLMRLFLRGRGARRLVAITRALGQAVKEAYHFPQREGFLQIAPDGVDLERYANLPTPFKARQLLDLPEGFTVGYSGHLYAGRGVELMLQTAAALPQVNFMLMGGEDERVKRLRQRAVGLGLGNLHFMGFIPNQELPRYQAACEALLMPYQSAVAGSSGGDIAPYLSPMKMFEYLASGRAVLASDLPVLAEVLEDGINALVLPAGDVSAWTAAIEKLQADPDFRLRLGEKGRETAAQHSWDRRASKVFAGL